MVSKKEEMPFIVGMALRAEKAKKHISQKLIEYAAEHGIHLKVIDENIAIEDQGHFDAICQKIRRREWEEELEAYAANHPDVSIHDMPQNTYVLRNRGTMLVPLQAPGHIFTPPPPCPPPPPSSSTIPPSCGINSNTSRDILLPIRCCAPAHTTIEANTSFEAAKTQLLEAQITYPILAKSLWADGSASSHALAVIHSDAGLLKIVRGDLQPEGLALPLLFEEYIDHGTCLFKVYVLGNNEVMVTRPSLHLSNYENKGENLEEEKELEHGNSEIDAADIDVTGEGLAGTSPPVPQLENFEASLRAPPSSPDVEIVSRVSAYPRARSWGKYDLAPRGHGVPVPPEWLWRGIAEKIRTQLGLSLFNFDLIVPLTPKKDQAGLVDPKSTVATEGLIYLIDINYFPGIEKLPNYEALLVQFFNDLREQQHKSSELSSK